MFLLNHSLIQQHISNNSSDLNIWQFKKENLEHTFYYFRLGSEGIINGKPYKLSDESENSMLTIQPNDYAMIKTHETFVLSSKFMGIFGQSSDLIKKGGQLLHSPFIDPMFKGKLEIGIKNISNKDIVLQYRKQIIGKISFFDISDTYPIVLKPNSLLSKKMNERKPEVDDASLHSRYEEDDDE